MFKLFPATLIDGQKIPLINGWREKATTDPVQIKAWQDEFRDRLRFFGAPTGAINGFFALDIDIKTNGWETVKQHNLVIPKTFSQRTLNGGTHFFFKAPPGVQIKNRVGFLPGLDIRGDGGWCAWYGIDTDWSVPIADAPDWLLNLPSKPVIDVTHSPVIMSPEIAYPIFQNALENIRNAAPGESNNILNIESYRVGQLVAACAISREAAETDLFKAAKDRGKPDYESRATITSGLDGGIKNPITSPFSTSPTLLTNPSGLPPPPEPATRWTPTYLTRAHLLNTSKLRKPQLFRDWSTEDITIVTADGGTGKTTMQLYEAVCLALGDRFLGFDNCQPGRTLYITGEDTADKLAAMLGAIMNQMGLMDGTPTNEAKIERVLNSVLIKKDADLCLITKTRDGFLLPNQQAFSKLQEAVHDIKPKMIVFDPIASFWGSESALNDMNKAVTRFMSDLVEVSGANVVMINHMGKSSSAQKDMTQFAGRGGSGLPSNSRVSRVLRTLSNEEYAEMCGMEIEPNKSAFLCNVNKFSDGSPLYNKPFIVVRNGYLFTRITLSPQKAREMEKEMDDLERVFTWIADQRRQNRYPTRSVVIGQMMNNGVPMSKDKVTRTIDMLVFSGHMGQKLAEVPHPDLTLKAKALIITDMDGKEV